MRRGHLHDHRELWQSGPNSFYRRKPVNVKDERRRVDIYEGFSPRFLFIEGFLYVAVPVVYC